MTHKMMSCTNTNDHVKASAHLLCSTTMRCPARLPITTNAITSHNNALVRWSIGPFEVRMIQKIIIDVIETPKRTPMMCTITLPHFERIPKLFCKTFYPYFLTILCLHLIQGTILNSFANHQLCPSQHKTRSNRNIH